MSPARTSSAGMIFSSPPDTTCAVCGVRCTSFFNARARLCNGQLLKKAAQLHAAQAANDRRAGQRQQRHILFDAAELQKRLQLFYQLFHVEPLL